MCEPFSSPAPADTRRGLTPLALAVHMAVASVLILSTTGEVHAQSETQAIQYDIPAGPLADALNRFAQQSGVSLVLDARQLEGLRTTGLQGRYGVEEGFGILLRGSGYAIGQTAAGYVLRAAPATRPATDEREVRQLGRISVTGTPLDDGTTEGTGSYTSGSMSTATGLSLSPRETPQSVSVVTRAQLDNEAALTLSDALTNATGVKTNEMESDGYTILMRGFNIDTIQVDGMSMDYVVQPGLFPFDMAIYDRIEILRGAAGLTQGAGRPGGTINLVRKMPASTAQLNFIARAGSWNDYRVEADVSGPLDDGGGLRARAVVAYQDRDSFTDFVGEKKEIAYGVLQADLGSATVATLGVDRTRAEGTPFSWGYPLYTDGGDLRLPRSTYLGAPWSHRDSKSTTVFLRIDQQLGSEWHARLSASAISASTFNRRLALTGQAVDRETGTGPLVFAPQATYDNDQEVFELQVDGPFSLFGQQHGLVFGASHQRSKGRNVDDSLSGPWFLEQPNVFEFDPNDYVFPTDITRDIARTSEVTEQGGIYGLARFSISAPLKLFLGARVNWWQTKYDYASELYEEFSSYAFDSDAEIVPYGGVTFDVAPQTTLYASYTDIYQPQNVTDRSGALLDPVVGANYEIGVKRSFADEQLLATFAAFRIEQTNLPADDLAGPFPCPSDPGGLSYCQVASGETRVEGLEAELAGNIRPGWQLTLGYAFTETKYVDGENAGRPFNLYQPRHKANLSTAYHFEGALDWLTLGGSIYWQSEFRIPAQDMPELDIVQNPYALVGLMARARISNSLSAGLNVNNALDKRYYKLLTHERAYNYYGDPRSFMLTLQGTF